MFKAVVIKYISGAIPGDPEIPLCFLAVLVKNLKSLKDYAVKPVIFFSRIAGVVNNRILTVLVTLSSKDCVKSSPRRI